MKNVSKAKFMQMLIVLTLILGMVALSPIDAKASGRPAGGPKPGDIIKYGSNSDPSIQGQTIQNPQIKSIVVEANANIRSVGGWEDDCIFFLVLDESSNLYVHLKWNENGWWETADGIPTLTHGPNEDSFFKAYFNHNINVLNKAIIDGRIADGYATYWLSTFSPRGSESRGNYLDPLEAMIKEAIRTGSKDPIYWDEGNILPNYIMKLLYNNPEISLDFKFTYEGVEHEIFIGPGQATNDDIECYGPLWLLARYGEKNTTAMHGVYTIVEGDTLNKLALKFGTTVDELMRLNPSIKDRNKIYAGRILNY